MRIALAGTFGGYGGIQTHLRWLTVALLELGHSVRILSLGPSVSQSERASFTRLVGDADVELACPQVRSNGCI